jgi:hypothetical protein
MTDERRARLRAQSAALLELSNSLAAMAQDEHAQAVRSLPAAQRVVILERGRQMWLASHMARSAAGAAFIAQE